MSTTPPTIPVSEWLLVATPCPADLLDELLAMARSRYLSVQVSAEAGYVRLSVSLDHPAPTTPGSAERTVVDGTGRQVAVLTGTWPEPDTPWRRWPAPPCPVDPLPVDVAGEVVQVPCTRPAGHDGQHSGFYAHEDDASMVWWTTDGEVSFTDPDDDPDDPGPADGGADYVTDHDRLAATGQSDRDPEDTPAPADPDPTDDDPPAGFEVFKRPSSTAESTRAAVLAVLGNDDRDVVWTSREVQAALPSHQGSTVDATLRWLASHGRIAKGRRGEYRWNPCPDDVCHLENAHPGPHTAEDGKTWDGPG